MNLAAAATVYNETLAMHGSANVELEIRLGRQVGSSFVPGVSKVVFDGITALLNNPSFTKTVSNTHEKLDKQGARHITDIDTKTSYVQYKKKIHSVTEEFSINDYLQRISISIEKSDPSSAENTSSNCTTYFRNKKRISYENNGWRFDLTRVSGNLPEMADNDDDTYEVELELADPQMVYMYTAQHLMEWGHALMNEILLKID
jgi:hypothetical protein